MTEHDDPSTVLNQRQEQMLRLVAKGFYNELINYGVTVSEVLAVAGHLLDNVMQKGSPTNKQADYYNQLFTTRDVQDNWATAEHLTVQQVSISPLASGHIPQVVTWLREPAIRDSFYPRFPDSPEELARYVQVPTRFYFAIFHQHDLVGIIGAEQIDRESAKLEMRKLVGDPRMHGKGIGKLATFLFLYYAFVIQKFRKVFIYSMDVNVRNLNLNGRFGFELEGVFFENAFVQNAWRDVVRMSLSSSVWLELFAQDLKDV
jgi:RimJ/RimL family protein N-acetyltransferase